MEDIILVGYGGHAKSVADCIERMNKYNIIGYTDFEEAKDARYCYLGTDDALVEMYNRGVKNAVVSVGYLGKGSLRQRLYSMLKSIGFNLPVIADPSSIVASDVICGEGTFIGKGAIVNSEASIGKMCIINTGAIIEHECVLGDFVHVAVGTVLCGQVRIGDAAFVGANATVIQCMRIQDRQIVPAGVTIR